MAKRKTKPTPGQSKQAQLAQNQRPKQREMVFQKEFLEDLRFWVETERNTALKVLELVEAIMRDPSSGIGKPEPLRHLAANTFSRRITQEHRLVYLVHEDRVDFLQCRYHY